MTLYPHSCIEDLLHASAVVCGQLANKTMQLAFDPVSRCNGTVRTVRREREREVGR